MNVGAVLILPNGFQLAPPERISSDLKTRVGKLYFQPYSAEQKNILVKNIPKQIAFNVVPQIDIFLDNGFTKEEIKMVNETNKILDPNISVNATCVRVSTEIGHAESVYFELENNINVELIKTALKNKKEIIFSDIEYHTPIDCSGNDGVYVSRLRKDLVKQNGFNIWVVSDNLLKGAALNSVQIAESLIKLGKV